MAANAIVRAPIQKLHLLLQLVRRGPVVIAFEAGDVFSAADFADSLTVPVHADVLVVENGADNIWPPRRELFDNFAGAVCGAVFPND